jgi:hypothetical protein
VVGVGKIHIQSPNYLNLDLEVPEPKMNSKCPMIILFYSNYKNLNLVWVMFSGI